LSISYRTYTEQGYKLNFSVRHE